MCDAKRPQPRGGGGQTPGSPTGVAPRGRADPGSATPLVAPGWAHPGHRPGVGHPGWGTHPGHQRPFFFKLGNPNKKCKNKQKSVFFATCLAFWTVPVYKKRPKKSSKNPARSRKNRNSSFYSPDPSSTQPLRRPDPRIPPGPPGCAHALVAPGSSHPGQRPREMWPDPAPPGATRRCPGSGVVSHRR